MKRRVERLAQGQYDCLVIGGGINGAAIAHLAARQGLKVALVEKSDFASGTSSKSTKLVHGGIRYLENFDFPLVKEALRERYIQLKCAPHLVKPLPFIIPVYKNDKRPLWMMKAGVWLYDFLSGPYRIGKHRSLTREEVLKEEPELLSEGLLGGVLYYDAQMDDARLCLENVLMADQYGAHIANYVEVIDFLKTNGKVSGVMAKDLRTQRVFKIQALKTVMAVGPWTNRCLKMSDRNAPKKIRTTKGVHVVYRGKISRQALLITSKQDSRIFFVIPWLGNTLIGTTDTNYIRRPEEVDASQKDIDYLLKEAQRVLPEIKFVKENIITTFAGLRPLIRKYGSPSKVSRQHVIDETYSGLIYVIGGKYTTYRKIAEDVIKKIMKGKFNDGEEGFSVFGSGQIDQNIKRLAKEYHLAEETVEYLISVYGARCVDVLEIVKEDLKLKAQICSCSLAIKAQVVYAIRTEMACVDADIIERRLSLGYLPCETLQCRKIISKLMKEYASENL